MMVVVYSGEKPPDQFSKSIFLAGPTPRSSEVKSWRPEALRLLESVDYDGVVFVPESRGACAFPEYADQIEWEEQYLHMSDCIVFWIPRELKTMPAFTTNIEWGVWQDSGKVVFGAPPDAEKIQYQQSYASKLKVRSASTLHETLGHALWQIGAGALRSGGERDVPLHVWKTAQFQQWYAAQKAAGNRLDGARLHWTFRVGAERNNVFLWALHVNVHIAQEDRNKTNEFVIGRPDIATVVMYRRRESFEKTDIVLIREFRSPVANELGFVLEVPGGSSFKPSDNPKALAASECEEETGLHIDPSRIFSVGSRQMVSTLLAHKAHVYAVEIGDNELAFLRAQAGIAHGLAEDSERTYVEVTNLKHILQSPHVDWSMLGMILAVMHKQT